MTARARVAASVIRLSTSSSISLAVSSEYSRSCMMRSIMMPSSTVEDLVTQLGAHALVDDHVAGDFGGFLQVIARTGRDTVLAIDDFFGDAATEGAGQDVFKFDDRCVAAVFGWQEPGDTTGTTARNDRDLVDWVAIWQDVADDGVAGFVVGRQSLFPSRS